MVMVRSIIVMSLVLIGRLVATAADVTVTTRVDSQRVVIGDWITMIMEIRHPKGVIPLFADFSDSLRGIELLRRELRSPAADNDFIVNSETFTLTAFDTGMFVIPPVAVAFRTAGDSTIHTASSFPIAVFVRGIQVDTAGEIKDVKPPIGVPITFADVLPYLLVLAGIAAVIAIIIHFRRRKKTGEWLIPAQPPRPAYEIALDELKALESERLWERGLVKQYHSQLTDVVRTYIERRFGTIAMEMVTDEILGSTPIAELDDIPRDDLVVLLRRADMVKFAKFLPTPEEHTDSMRRSFAFVEGTSRPAMTAKRETVPVETGQ